MPRTFIVYLFFTLVPFLLTSHVVAQNTGLGTKSKENIRQESDVQFVLPVIPLSIVSDEARADYFVTHFWDSFNFSDTSFIHKPQITERAFISYALALPVANRKQAVKSISTTMQRAEMEKTGAMYNYFRKLFEKYFYDSYSPIRNDEFYIPVVEYIIQDKRTDAVEKERMRFNLSILKKNRIGEPANDFKYTTQSGQTDSLYGISNKYIVLFFYNPDCQACAQTISLLKQSRTISSAVNTDKLAIFAIYPDSDLEIWKKHLPDIPDYWINGYDKNQTIETNLIYDLKAIPTLYLLDKDKKVILKDTDFNVLEEWIANNL